MEGKVDDYQKLQAAIPNLQPKDQEFAQSLMEWVETKGGWSANQEKWVKILILRAEQNAQPKPSAKVGEVDGIIELFDKAKKHLKYPAIVLIAADNGDEIKVKPAPSSGSNPGSIYVHYNGAYAGKISPGGEWYPTKATNLQGFIWCMLKDLAADPAGVAAKHGKLTGKCCFCNTKLTDPKSTGVGYGPVCAKNYDLPWGASMTADTLTEAVSMMKQLASEGSAVGAQEASQTHLDDAALQSHVPDPDEPLELNSEGQSISWEETIAIEKEFRAERVAFDCVPGKAVKNLLDALNG
jgi:hypothetical protein